MLLYLLDTNICIDAIKHRAKSLSIALTKTHLIQGSPPSLSLSCSIAPRKVHSHNTHCPLWRIAAAGSTWSMTASKRLSTTARSARQPSALTS